MVQTTLREYLQATEDAIGSGHIDEALANCQHMLSYFPEALEVQRLLGEIYLEQGHLEEAQQTFDWILTSDPENVLAYCNRALISERMLDFDTALDCYQQAYELSRGNSQIRKEFNQLSAKVGQPAFMFSRAGLARLYMRGDLLPQAVSEWKAVLNASPDRLDARLGLLETYWREGLYEQARQLATQILQDVPSCLKALLLLAHVTSIHDIQQAIELIQQAESLDPELVVAHELFGDLMAGQPNDPFVALLKKGPINLPEISKGVPASLPDSHATVSNGSTHTPAFSDSLTSWSSLDTLAEAPQVYQPMQNFSPFAPLPDRSIHRVDPLVPGQSARSESQPDPWASAQSTMGESPPDFWQGQQDLEEEDLDAVIAHDQALLEQQPWYHADQVAEPTAAPEDPWGSVDDPFALQLADSWSAASSEKDADPPATPPAWLDMLTKGERHQPSGAMPPLSAPAPVAPEPPAVPSPAQPPMQAPSASSIQAPLEEKPSVASEQDETPLFSFASDGSNAEDMGWPEWLKSLGAQSMEGSSQADPVALPPTQVEAQSPPAPVDPQAAPITQAQSLPQQEQQPIPVDPWAVPAAQAQPLPQSEQSVITTLENLEQELRAQGFTPLEPGTLSTLAQGQETAVPSALTQLGNFVGQRTNVADTPLSTLPPVAPGAPVSQPVEPLWHATLGPASNPASSPNISAPPEPAIAAESWQSPVSVPVGDARTMALPEPAMAPATRTEPLLDFELETTMKRPAVRLQPMQQRPASGQLEQIAPASKDHSASSGERPVTGKAPEGHLSYKDRLVRGYHYQLAGTNDEAMQEYRIIIRNAPELLGEVISNLRALLKLAPKYSAGYRVLGDAYMRQGEYLQAMEAYNKALTMTKKAKGKG